MGTGRLALVAFALLLAPQQKPTFQSGVELVVVDVHVVDKAGHPIRDLTPEEVEVQIAGKTRSIRSLQLIDYSKPLPPLGVAGAASATGTVAAALPPHRPRRMFILAVDEHSLHISNALAAVNAAERFIDRLQPDDLVGLYAYPTGTAHHDLTSDHAAVRRALRHVTGLFQEPSSRFDLSPSEIVDIASGDRETLLTVVRRCRGGCSQGDVQREATSLVGFMEMRVAQSAGGLRGLVRALGGIAGRKVLVLVSGGLISTDRGTGRANASGEIAQLGREAALANLSVFALHLDWSFLQALSSRSGLRSSYFRDAGMSSTGLEMLAGAAGGAVVRVQGTSPDVGFDRVLSETSAYYLIGVEPPDAAMAGQSHQIRVRVRRRGATVRARTEVLIPSK